jgi:hypothetical protein
LDAKQKNLPFEACASSGTWQVEYNPASGYVFDHWENTGGVFVSNTRDSATTITVNDDGILKAVYRAYIPTLFSDGFESGSFSAWTGTSRSSGETAAVASGLSYQGKYGARFSSDGLGRTEYAYSYKTVESSADVYAQGYFYVSRSRIVNNYDGFYFLSLKTGGLSVAQAGWRKIDSVIRWCLVVTNGRSNAIIYSTSKPSMNRWYCVEIHWKKGTTDGLCELWIDGTKVCSAVGRNTAAYGSVNQVCFGLPKIFCKSTTVYLDCAEIAKEYIGTRAQEKHLMGASAYFFSLISEDRVLGDVVKGLLSIALFWCFFL